MEKFTGEKQMKKKYDKNNQMTPLWFEYPGFSRYCIGWRMGAGEDYRYEFIKWYKKLTIEEQEHYKQMFPTPIGWLGWYEEEFTNNDIYDEEGLLLWSEKGDLKYSLESIYTKYQKGEKLEYIFFWGHQPSKDGSISRTCLSQWWKSDFYIDGDKYCCMEQYMMAEKARAFDDEEITEKILKSSNPKQIKDLGRKVKNFEEDVWNRKKKAVILNGNYAKFLQNEDLKQFLLETKNKVLVEASPYDKIWGIGLSIDDEKVTNPFKWKGQNLLGFTLMEVRDELRRVCKK